MNAETTSSAATQYKGEGDGEMLGFHRVPQVFPYPQRPGEVLPDTS